MSKKLLLALSVFAICFSSNTFGQEPTGQGISKPCIPIDSSSFTLNFSKELTSEEREVILKKLALPYVLFSGLIPQGNGNYSLEFYMVASGGGKACLSLLEISNLASHIKNCLLEEKLISISF